jgi:hypothetical protein
MIKRNTLNFATDLFIAAIFLSIIGTGLVIRYVLPAGSGHSRTLWSLGRHDWGDVHFWLAVAACVLALLHVALHWQWVCVTASRLARADYKTPGGPARITRRAAAGISVIVLAVSLTGFTWIARSNVRAVSSGTERASAVAGNLGLSDGHGATLRGSMTLADASAVTHLSVAQMRQILDLGADASPDQRLGQLSREAGLTMAQARDKLMQAARQR